MKCRDCKFLSEPRVFGEPENYPCVRCTLGLWDHDNKTGEEQWYSFGESQLNRGPIRRHGDMCEKGKFKKSFGAWYKEFQKYPPSPTGFRFAPPEEYFQAGAEAQLKKLASTTDEELVEITLKFLRSHYDTWEADKCGDCCDFEADFCNMVGLDIDTLKNCPQADLAFPNNAKDLLSQLTPYYKAKQEQAVKEAWELQDTLLNLTVLNQTAPKIILTNDECGWVASYLPNAPSNEGLISVMKGNPLEAVRSLSQTLKEAHHE